MIHELKCHPEPFQAKWDEIKTEEYRKDDRNYQPGDFLREREWKPYATGGSYTGREIVSMVKDIRRELSFGIMEGYCMMSLFTIFHRDVQGEVVYPRSGSGSGP